MIAVDLLAGCCWELVDDVYPLFHEWPWGDYGSETLWGKMRDLCKTLADVTPLDVGDGIRLQSWLVIACSQSSVGQAVSPGMVATFPLVGFS